MGRGTKTKQVLTLVGRGFGHTGNAPIPKHGEVGQSGNGWPYPSQQVCEEPSAGKMATDS